MKVIRVVVCVAALGVAGGALGQEAPLVTDRPDFTESSEVVGPQRLQFESGVAYERSGGSGSAMAPGSGAGWTIDGGISRQVGGNLQFDVEAGRGLTAAAPDWFFGFGFAMRGHFGSR